MACCLVKFRVGPSAQTVALYEDILPEELSEILKATLPILGDILGVQDEERNVIPLSLLCKNPFVLTGSVYGILVSDQRQAREAPAPPVPSAPPLAASESIVKNSPEVHIEPSLPASAPLADSGTLTSSALEDIINFISYLRTNNFLSRGEHEALHHLLSTKSSLLPAAYSVAKSTKDSKYFAQICKDIAESLMSYSGQSACSAQEDVLQCCDQLYINNQIDEEQLLYLRHLVLIRDNGIASLYDQFQANRSPEDLIRGLCRAAGGADTAPGDDDDEGRESSDSESSLQEESSSSSSSSSDESPPSPTRLEGVIKTLNLTPVQGLLLSYLVKEQDRKVVAAFAEFRRYGDLQSLRETLTQIAIDEDQKMRNEDEEADSPSGSATPSSTGDDEEEEQDNGFVVPQSPVASSSLDSLLSAMGETNRWAGSVPSRFVLAVFAAAQKKLLAVGHASGLCDLFQIGNELVHAAWEVFNSQGDVIDFIDTLRRIVKFAVQEAAEDQDDSSEDTLPRMIGSPKQKRSEVTTFDVEETERQREDAQEEVASAKRDLLKHSLDLLSKQGLISAEAAVLLFRQSLEDSSETDLAIETYAANKDMMEFLKTLMNLATQATSSPPKPEASQESPSEALYVSGALMTIADHLLEEKIIPDSLYSSLVSLIKDKNPALKAAWVKYREQSCSLTDVVDVMLALSLGTSPAETMSTDRSQPAASSVLTSDDYKNIIDIYVRAQALLPEEKAKLDQLIDAGHSAIAPTFAAFEEHRDVHKLLNALREIISSASAARRVVPEEEVESKFLSIVKKMNLTSDETSALREAIASDDPLLRSALELYRSDENEGNLMTNLKAISQRLMKTSPSRRSAATQASPAPQARAQAPASSVSPPIQDLFPVLLNEFVKHKIFSAENAATLRQMYGRNDEVLVAALDLYELDRDLAGLVDSLEKILKYV